MENSNIVSVLYDRAGVMERLDNDAELCNEVLATYLKESPALFQRLKESIDTRSLAACKKNAHTLKGAAGNVGVTGISENARKIESSLSKEDWEEIRLLFQKMTDQFQELIIQAKEFGVGE